MKQIKINTAHSDEFKYNNLLPQIIALINREEPLVSNLSNITAAFKEMFPKISWVGFYFKKNGKLFLGPFQGKTACTVIKIGEGVCGISAEKMETVIVGNIDNFPGHIACDADSKSEIVIPIVNNGKLLGVLDIDSYEYNSFGEIDRENLKKICTEIFNRLEFSDKFLK